MNEADKMELAELFVEILESREKHCPLGISPETARELIDFANAWRKARRTALATLAGALAASVFAALAAGIRALV